MLCQDVHPKYLICHWDEFSEGLTRNIELRFNEIIHAHQETFAYWDYNVRSQGLKVSRKPLFNTIERVKRKDDSKHARKRG